ncbi:MAG: TRAP transporter substrate-binding protein [Pseudomonadota bacterium]
MRFVKSLLIGTGLALSVLSLPVSVQAQTWDLPSAYAPANFHTVNLEKFAAGVKNATGGKLVIKVHSGASLYKATEIKRAVQTGQVPAGEILMTLLSNENSVFAADGLPFLANSYEAARKLAAVQRPQVEKVLDAQGLKLLFWVPWPPQGLMAPKEINGVADMAGLNFRAYDKHTARLGELVKARPVTIQAAEVAQALATGKINSLIASAQSATDYKAWESLKYFYDVQAWLPKNMVIVNKASFNALDKATQDALLAEARKAEEAGWAASRETAEATKKILVSNGMKVQPGSDKLVAELNKVGQQMLDDWLSEASSEGKAVVSAYRK